MFTPYDWQEGIGHRAQYVEGKLAQGAPVLAVSLQEGILVYTFRRQAPKIYEVYDRLVFAGIGQQSDVEALRVAAVDFAHQEGFRRSEQDVTIQRVVSSLSAPIKRAFGDFSTAPFVVRGLFAEVAERPQDDSYHVLDYDGDYSTRTGGFAFVAGGAEAETLLKERLGALKLDTLQPEKAVDALRQIWLAAVDPSGEREESDVVEGLQPEAVVLERKTERENRFRWLTRLAG
jgi:proteasome alpha subunit